MPNLALTPRQRARRKKARQKAYRDRVKARKEAQIARRLFNTNSDNSDEDVGHQHHLLDPDVDQQAPDWEDLTAGQQEALLVGTNLGNNSDDEILPEFDVYETIQENNITSPLLPVQEHQVNQEDEQQDEPVLGEEQEDGDERDDLLNEADLEQAQRRLPYKDRKENMAMELAAAMGSSNMSQAAITKVMKIFAKNLPTFTQFTHEEGDSMSYRHSLRPLAMKEIPKYTNDVITLHQDDEGHWIKKERKGLPTIPNEALKYRSCDGNVLLRSDCRTTLAELKRFHRLVLQRQGLGEDQALQDFNNIYISSDGVQISQHAKRKLDVISVRFGLRAIYFYKVMNPLCGRKEAKPRADEKLLDLIHEINADPQCHLVACLHDMIERHHVKGMVGVSAYYSCEFCLRKGSTGSGIQWPHVPRRTFPLRQPEDFAHVMRHGVNTGHKRTRGITDVSPLLHVQQPGFNIVLDVPVDAFHLLYEGVTKAILVRCFIKCQNFYSRTKFSELTLVYENTSVFSETARRPAPILVKQLKGNQLQTLTLAVFPCLIDFMADGTGVWQTRRRVIAVYTFLSRLYHYGDQRLEEASRQLRHTTVRSLEALHEIFYAEYTDSFVTGSKQRVTINVHVFAKHLLASRRRTGALWKTSTEAYEASYSVMARCYHEGTNNVAKQIQENMSLHIQ